MLSRVPPPHPVSHGVLPTNELDPIFRIKYRKRELFSGCLDTERIFKISTSNGFRCVDPLFGSLQFKCEMNAKQKESGVKEQDLKEYRQFVSALTNASGVWMTASYLNHNCLGSFVHLPFFLCFDCKL